MRKKTTKLCLSCNQSKFSIANYFYPCFLYFEELFVLNGRITSYWRLEIYIDTFFHVIKLGSAISLLIICLFSSQMPLWSFVFFLLPKPTVSISNNNNSIKLQEKDLYEQKHEKHFTFLNRMKFFFFRELEKEFLVNTKVSRLNFKTIPLV